MLFDPPLLLCADLQNEALSNRETYFIAEAREIVANCIAAQEAWRKRMWPIVHLRRIATAEYFDPTSNLTEWIEVTKPAPAEMCFGHPLPSAYSSVRFSEYMAHIGRLRCVVIGFSLHDSIISTIIEGFHRGVNFVILSDAVGCTHTVHQGMKPLILEILRSFAKIATDIEGAL